MIENKKLIDATAWIEELEKEKENLDPINKAITESFIEKIKERENVDPENHSKWITNIHGGWNCENCGCYDPTSQPYCGKCGYKMDKETEEEQKKRWKKKSTKNNN